MKDEKDNYEFLIEELHRVRAQVSDDNNALIDYVRMTRPYEDDPRGAFTDDVTQNFEDINWLQSYLDFLNETLELSDQGQEKIDNLKSSINQMEHLLSDIEKSSLHRLSELKKEADRKLFERRRILKHCINVSSGVVATVISLIGYNFYSPLLENEAVLTSVVATVVVLLSGYQFTCIKKSRFLYSELTQIQKLNEDAMRMLTLAHNQLDEISNSYRLIKKANCTLNRTKRNTHNNIKSVSKALRLMGSQKGRDK